MDRFTLEKVDFDAIRRLLAEFCNCSLGKGMAMRIMPGKNLHAVHSWLEETSQMVEVIRDHGVVPFGGVLDIHDAVSRAQPGHGATAEDFLDIASTLDAASRIREHLKKLPEKFTHMHSMADGLGDFSTQVKLIQRVISPTGKVREDASETMAKLCEQIDSVTRKIHTVIENYLRDADCRRLLQSPTITLHGDRYVLPVKAENRGRLDGVVHRASNTGATVFIEPSESVTLNNQLVDLQDSQRREVERLFSELSVRLVARNEDIARTLRTLGKLDLVCAKAQYAYQYDMTCPEVSPDGELEFFRARHPLLEAAYRKATKLFDQPDVKPVVPIDIRLGSDFDILIITGSNTGGKTVTLKTTALLVLMAQAGLHIPAARGAKMPLFEDVLIDIGDEQSLEQSLSTFGAHIQRMKHILHRVHAIGRKCLVLLDELGSGTDPDEGSAIGQAILDDLRRTKTLAVITTHLSTLKAYAMNHDRVENASVEFDTATLAPTYHLHIGTPGESHAITVASKLGIHPRIIADAKRHFGRRGWQLRNALRMTGQVKRQAEQARAEATEAEIAARDRIDSYEAKLDDVNKVRSELSQWMARLSEMKSGEEVFIPAAGKTGRLVRVELHKQRLVVNLDALQYEVPLMDVMPDVGQAQVRNELADYRRQVKQNVAASQQLRDEANELFKQAKTERHRRQEQSKHFKNWLECLKNAKAGDVVPIAHAPGKAKLVELKLATQRAEVELPGGEKKEISIHDMFPQGGPFGPKHHKGRPGKPDAELSKPVPHGHTHGSHAKESHQKLLAAQPGDKVYVIPFSAPATLVRINETHEKATVLKGAFEIEVALSDLAPIHS